MTARQIEQLTPRIHPALIDQTTRRWEQPKIRLHNPVQSTPPTVRESLPSHPFRSTRVRVTAPSDRNSHRVTPALNATPVTHPSIPKPLKFRIAGAETERNPVCRQLFTNSTPAKRPRHDTPSFRFSCGRDRTQPSSDPTRNLLVNTLDAHIHQARENSHIFRNGLSTNFVSPSFQAAIKEGLLFDISSRHGNILVLKPHAHHAHQQTKEVAIVVTDEMLSEQISPGNQYDHLGHSVYIPYPWHAQIVNGLNSCNSRILIAAHWLEIFRTEHLASFDSLTINTALDNLPMPQLSAHEPEIPPAPSVFRFAALSSYSITTNLSIFVDLYDPSHQLAIIRDDVDELAVLITRNGVLQRSSRKLVLNNVSILPYKVLPHVILEALGDKVDAQLRSMLVGSRDDKSYLVFQI